MASPVIGGGKPLMPRQPGGRPELVVDPMLPGGGRPKRPRQRVKNLERMPRIIDDKVTQPGFPSPQPYAPIKQTKAVGKVYKTY